MVWFYNYFPATRNLWHPLNLKDLKCCIIKLLQLFNWTQLFYESIVSIFFTGSQMLFSASLLDKLFSH